MSDCVAGIYGEVHDLIGRAQLRKEVAKKR